MTITLSPRLGLDEFAAAALKERFLRLIYAGELSGGDSYEFALESDGQMYILGPNLEFDEDEGETVITGYTLMRVEEWNI